MPKIKTKSSAKKRFKKMKSGLIKYSQAFRRHLLGKKSSKRKRDLRQAAYLCKADAKVVAWLLPY
ncbi:MAG: 50S ribosomal protein L35 [Candidatus Babeliales bacterium]